MLLKLTCTFLLLSLITIVSGGNGSGNNNNKKQQQQFCNSISSFCDHCQMQTGNCNRMSKECESILKEEDAGSSQLTLCRQVRGQCNLCKNQGRNCRNLQRQCNPPANATTTKPSSPEMTPGNWGQMEGPSETPVIGGKNKTSTQGNKNKNKNNNNNNNCRKFGMRCGKKSPCCEGLACNSGENNQSRSSSCVMVNSKDHSRTVMRDVKKRGNPNNRHSHW